MRRARRLLENIAEMLQDYRFNSILVKNLVVILTLLLAAFAFMTLIVTARLSKIQSNEMATYARHSIEQTGERMETLMNEVVQISAQLSLEADVESFLLPMPDGSVDSSAAYAVMEKLREYTNTFDYIDSIYIYSNKGQYVVADNGGSSVDKFKDREGWYKNITERVYEPARMISRSKFGSYPVVMTYIQPVRLTQMQFLGAVVINLDVEKLYAQTAVDASDIFLIADDRGNILFNTDSSLEAAKLNRLPFRVDLEGTTEDTRELVYNGEHYIASSLDSGKFRWSYFSLISSSQFRESRASFNRFVLRMIFAVILLAVTAAVFLAYYSYRPVRHILELLKNPDLFDAESMAGPELRQNELQEITGNIARNFYSNRKVQKELEDYLQIVNRAQITALQAQISPHFLFNTLENLRWRAMAICKGDNEVSQIILNLSEMLRLSLDNSKQIISLDEEIHNARLYTEILALRYKNKMHVEWDIDDTLRNCQIVKVTLQPLLENAVYHGTKPKRGGRIRVTARQAGAKMEILVADDGVGMSAEACTELNHDLAESYAVKEGHIGVRNVAQRLRLIMGDEAEMHVESREGLGTTVRILLPIRDLCARDAERKSGM